MLTIRKKSVAVMKVSQRKQFVADYLPVLRREFPELWFEQTDEDVARTLDEHCAWAARYQVERSRGIYAILTLRLRLDWNFPEGPDHAWAREILHRDLRPEDERIDALEKTFWGASTR